MRNRDATGKVISDLMDLPDKIHAAGLEEAIFQVPLLTRQDSGNAAFNWYFDSGKTTSTGYFNMKGIPPVGMPGDKRSDTGNRLSAVSKYKAKEAVQLLQAIRDGMVKETAIINVIDDPKYAKNAKLNRAIDAVHSGIRSEMNKAVRDWYSESNRKY